MRNPNVRTVLLAGALAACGQPFQPNARVDDPHLDDDGDGLSELEGDCDDGDPSVSPAAVEVCDGEDNDCDGLIDDQDDDLQADLRWLGSADMVQLTPGASGKHGTYVFKHKYLQDVAY